MEENNVTPLFIDKEEATKVLLEDQKMREETCVKEVASTLEKYGCQLQAYPVIIDGKIETRVQVRAV